MKNSNIHFILGYKGAWFWKQWKDNTKDFVNFMKENYPPKFTYQDFGRDLKMEFFNATCIADIVKESGARFTLLYFRFTKLKFI